MSETFAKMTGVYFTYTWLADTVVDFDQQLLEAHKATGFLFDRGSHEALLATCLGALSLFRNDRVDWWKLVIAGMKREFSWTQSARMYEEIYARLAGQEQENQLHE